MITDKRITLISNHYTNRLRNKLPITHSLKQQLVRIILSKQQHYESLY